MKEMQELALDFIDAIPDSKLLGSFRTTKGLIHTDGDYRLDTQGMTSVPVHWNIQIQCNKYKGCKGKNSKSSVNIAAEQSTRKGGSTARIFVSCDNPWSPAKVKAELVKSVNEFFATDDD